MRLFIVEEHLAVDQEMSVDRRLLFDLVAVVVRMSMQVVPKILVDMIQ